MERKSDDSAFKYVFGTVSLVTNGCCKSLIDESCCRSSPINRALVTVKAILFVMQVCPGQETG